MFIDSEAKIKIKLNVQQKQEKLGQFFIEKR